MKLRLTPKIRAAVLVAMYLQFPLGWCGTLNVDLPPPPLRDKGKKPVIAFRQFTQPHLDDSGKPVEPFCAIRFLDSYFGYLPKGQFGIKATFDAMCYHSSDTLVNTAWAQPDGRGGWKLKGYEDQLDVMRFYSLESINAKGWAVTEEDKIGDEAGRAKRLHYCLVREQKALCGQGDMGYVQDIRRHPQNDLTNYTLRILRSIEFVDEPAAVAASAPAASAVASAP